MSDDDWLPPGYNVLLYNQEVVNHLYHTAAGSFWHDQPYRFELVHTEGEWDQDNPPDYGVMLWTQDNYLHAIMIYNWYVSNIVGDRAAILWDMAEDDPTYVVWIGLEGEWPENYRQIRS